jgi:hypothetical protein
MEPRSQLNMDHGSCDVEEPRKNVENKIALFLATLLHSAPTTNHTQTLVNLNSAKKLFAPTLGEKVPPLDRKSCVY